MTLKPAIMKTIGLIGGTSWHSTVAYYQLINQGVGEYIGTRGNPELILYSINIEIMREQDRDRINAKYREVSGKLIEAGATAILICANTPHMVYDFVQPRIDVPILQSQTFRVPENLTIRVRLKSITPEEPTPIQWRYGGEGQGGKVIRGVFPKAGIQVDAPIESHRLQVGRWSKSVPLVSFAKRFSDKFFLTITAGNPGKTIDRKTGRRGGCSTDVVFEFVVRARPHRVSTRRNSRPS